MSQNELVLSLLTAVDNLVAAKSGRNITSYSFKPRYTYQITQFDADGNRYSVCLRYSYLPINDFHTAIIENSVDVNNLGGFKAGHSYTVQCIGVRFPQESQI